MLKMVLMEYIGKRVKVYFTDGDIKEGVLNYSAEFSKESGFRKPKYFYIDDLCFRTWHVKKIVEVGK